MSACQQYLLLMGFLKLYMLCVITTTNWSLSIEVHMRLITYLVHPSIRGKWYNKCVSFEAHIQHVTSISLTHTHTHSEQNENFSIRHVLAKGQRTWLKTEAYNQWFLISMATFEEFFAFCTCYLSSWTILVVHNRN